jgi:hypothetical protein
MFRGLRKDQFCVGSKDRNLIVVKSMSRLDCAGNGQLDNSRECAVNLRHPRIAASIGLVFLAESRKTTITQLSVEGGLLAEVFVTSPDRLIPIAKAKAIAVIVLGLLFTHSFALIHVRLTASSVLFDVDHCILIAILICSV